MQAKLSTSNQESKRAISHCWDILSQGLFDLSIQIYVKAQMDKATQPPKQSNSPKGAKCELASFSDGLAIA